MPLSNGPTPFDQYRVMNARRRLVIGLLAVVTAITVVLTLLHPPGGVDRSKRPLRPDAERCAKGQSSGCVGGTAEVIVPAAAASGAR